VKKMEEKEIINKFIQFLETDSESLNEEKFVNLIKDEFKKISADEIIEDNAKEKIKGTNGNLIIRFNGIQNKEKPIILCAHLDTVKPGTNIKVRYKNNIFESNKETVLGADDKAAVAAIYFAIKEIKEEKIEHPPIEIVFTVAEEVGLLGSKFLDYKLLKGKYAYIFDADGKIGNIIVKSPQHIRYEVKIKGKASHAGIAPTKGKSAIKVAAEIISKIKIGKLDENTTANVGTINGGIATNIVPEIVIFSGEVRSHKEEILRNYITNLKEIIKRTCAKYKVKYELKIINEYKKMDVSEKSILVENFKNSIKGISKNIKLEKTMGGSDANLFNAKGIEAVNIAIEFIDIHSTNEKYKLSSLIKLKNLIKNLIKNWGE